VTAADDPGQFGLTNGQRNVDRVGEPRAFARGRSKIVLISGRKTRTVWVVGGAAAVLVGTGVTYAAVPDAGTNIYHGCMLTGIGTVRLIDPSLPSTNPLSHCSKLETPISWNQTGAQGPAGATGATGSQGPAGPVGVTGAPGTQGPAGAAGTNGKDGNTILSGTGAPADSVGNDGDFYLDTSADNLYGPKAGGSWPSAGTSLVGSPGTTGPAGPQGPAGPAGSGAISIDYTTSDFQGTLIDPVPASGFEFDVRCDTIKGTPSVLLEETQFVVSGPDVLDVYGTRTNAGGTVAVDITRQGNPEVIPPVQGAAPETLDVIASDDSLGDFSHIILHASGAPGSPCVFTGQIVPPGS
jgi:hypothetical protein